ncbi:hypothetical protein HNQ07_002480 [Deinococcus metalli]|uniref:Uncharacterized protein n=1 Tax=Deinococcus metalli TaxID=1141878 RepID=A0A7W8NPP5_9DEIO|nr:hypothetical protein [Deinococcus metalli]MBB5377016.1 hypothetical protein [Deinococcus metalli]GHF47082.1 hypothetical protein GCM10017781_24450 [Deinococcus metalli]
MTIHRAWPWLCVVTAVLLAGCAGPRRAAAQVGNEVGTVATGGAAGALQVKDRAAAQAADVYARGCALALEAQRAATGQLDPAVDGRPCSDAALGSGAQAAPPEVRASVVQVSGAGYMVTVTDHAGQVHTRRAP